MNRNFIVIGLSRLGIKPELTAPEAHALATGPSRLFKVCRYFQNIYNFLEVFVQVIFGFIASRIEL